MEITLPENNNQIFASKYQTVLPSKEELQHLLNERIKLQIGLDRDILWEAMISIILMVIVTLIVFFFGAGMNEAMSGAILLSMITGFACTINAIEKNKKK